MEQIRINNSLIKNFSKYTKTDRKKATIQIINSFGPFLLLWVLMYLSLDVSYWLTFGLGIVNSFFLVRIFIIQHDCGHRSFLSSNKARDIVGYVCSIFSTIPYHYWSKSHHIHHAHNGQLEMRDIGDIDTLTAREYRSLSKFGKLKHRLYRSLLVMFILAPIYYFMKTTIAPICLVLSLALGFSTPAVADHGRYGSYRGGHYAAQRYHHHPGHYRQDRWVAPAAVLALTGIAAGVAAATYYAPPPVYVAPPPVYVAPPPRQVNIVPAQPLYAPAPGRYWGY